MKNHIIKQTIAKLTFAALLLLPIMASAESCYHVDLLLTNNVTGTAANYDGHSRNVDLQTHENFPVDYGQSYIEIGTDHSVTGCLTDNDSVITHGTMYIDFSIDGTEYSIPLSYENSASGHSCTGGSIDDKYIAQGSVYNYDSDTKKLECEYKLIPAA